MSEEAIADSGVEEEVIQENEGVSQDALDTMSEQVFGSKPVVATDENEDVQEGLAGEKEEKAEPKEEIKEAKEEEKEVKSTLPASWKKDMQEKWDSIDPETQEYFLQREKQMADGLEKDRGDANLGRVMRDTMAPYSEMLKSQGIDEPSMVRNLMNAHYRISTADDAGKLALIKQFAQSYGLNLDGETQQVDPTIKALQDKLQGIEQHISTSHQQALQASRERVQSEVEAFASEHEFFDEVSEQIVPLINAGYELEDAYQNAIWLNPVTRQKEIDRTAKEAAEKAQALAKQEVEKARKAKSANVKGRDTKQTPTEPLGTMEDTMRETLRDMKNRSH